MPFIFWKAASFSEFLFIYLLLLLFLMASLTPYGSSQARDWIQATAVTYVAVAVPAH